MSSQSSLTISSTFNHVPQVFSHGAKLFCGFLNDSSSRVDLGGGTATRHSKSRSFFLLLSFSTPTRDPQFAIVEILIPILSTNYRDPYPFSEPVAAGRARVSGILVRWLTPQNRISIWNNFSSVSLSFRSLTPKSIFY